MRVLAELIELLIKHLFDNTCLTTRSTFIGIKWVVFGEILKTNQKYQLLTAFKWSLYGKILLLVSINFWIKGNKIISLSANAVFYQSGELQCDTFNFTFNLLYFHLKGGSGLSISQITRVYLNFGLKIFWVF